MLRCSSHRRPRADPSACATVQKLDAARRPRPLDLHPRQRRATFDSLVEPQALKREIQPADGRRAAVAGRRVSAVAALLGPTLADLAGETIVQPRVFRAVAEHYGYTRRPRSRPSSASPPTLKPLPDGGSAR